MVAFFRCFDATQTNFVLGVGIVQDCHCVAIGNRHDAASDGGGLGAEEGACKHQGRNEFEVHSRTKKRNPALGPGGIPRVGRAQGGKARGPKT